VANEYYELLGVVPTATRDEIRKAYALKVREAPPEREPEKFTLVRRAYETLCDEAARRDYDALEAHGARVAVLTERAGKCMEEEEWADAERAWKEVLVLWPDGHAASNGLGLCQLEQGRWSESRRTFRALTSNAPDVVAYWVNYGLGYFRESMASDRDGPVHDDLLLVKARNRFRKAIELDPRASVGYELMARTYIHEEELGKALEWMEKAIQSDGKVDAGDVDILIQRCIIHARLERRSDLAAEATRIRSCLPDEPDARKHVSGLFAQHAGDWVRVKGHQSAAWFIAEATNFDPYNRELWKHRLFLFRLADACSSIERLRQDPQIDRILGARALYVVGRLGGYLPDDKSEDQKAFQTFVGAIEGAQGSIVYDQILLFRASYPACFDLDEELLDDVLLHAAKVCNRRVPAKNKDRERCISCGCLPAWGHDFDCYGREGSGSRRTVQTGGSANSSAGGSTTWCSWCGESGGHAAGCSSRPATSSPVPTAASVAGPSQGANTGTSGCAVLVAGLAGLLTVLLILLR